MHLRGFKSQTSSIFAPTIPIISCCAFCCELRLATDANVWKFHDWTSRELPPSREREAIHFLATAFCHLQQIFSCLWKNLGSESANHVSLWTIIINFRIEIYNVWCTTFFYALWPTLLILFLRGSGSVFGLHCNPPRPCSRRPQESCPSAGKASCLVGC